AFGASVAGCAAQAENNMLATIRREKINKVDLRFIATPLTPQIIGQRLKNNLIGFDEKNNRETFTKYTPFINNRSYQLISNLPTI
ncbi:MAG TPA: hypothetical protein VLR89_01040, partial [Anaerolineaceae bacterium]|nr:hypothetical protein [Anaerolineaceae bacterium]